MDMRFIETIKDEIYYIDINPGQLIYCSDTNESFFDTEDETRILIDNIIYLNKEEEKEKILSPLVNRIYVVKESGIMYKYEGSWFKVLDPNRVICTLYRTDEYIPVTITKQQTKIAPRTLASVVYDDSGFPTGDLIETANKLTLCKTKYVYVEATEQGQKVFRIPYPISDYDFRKNFMTVIINNTVYTEDRFTIRDNDFFVLNDSEIGLDSGQLVIFIFYYNVYVDVNDGVLLYTKNLRDKSVTEPKLADSSVSTRTIIDKNITNIKIADNAIDSRTIANNAVSGSKLVDNSISGAKILDSSVSNTKLADNSVSTTKIQDGATTSAKLATNAVTTDKIADKNITNTKISDNAIDSRTLSDASVTTTHLNLSSISIPVSNISETMEKKFISQSLLDKVESAPRIHVSVTEPDQNVNNNDIWVDITEFIFKVRVSNEWKPMGAVYK